MLLHDSGSGVGDEEEVVGLRGVRGMEGIVVECVTTIRSNRINWVCHQRMYQLSIQKRICKCNCDCCNLLNMQCEIIVDVDKAESEASFKSPH